MCLTMRTHIYHSLLTATVLILVSVLSLGAQNESTFEQFKKQRGSSGRLSTQILRISGPRNSKSSRPDTIRPSSSSRKVISVLSRTRRPQWT